MSQAPLYVAEETIQVRATSGRFSRLRLISMCILIGGYYLLPWLNINGNPALLLDLVNRRFYVLGATFVPQDLIYLSLLLIISALGLFFVTTIAGRVFCGYACPQTVWTELFMWIEHLIEGDRAKRIKLDQQPWDLEKISKRGGKHLVWIVVALLTGLTFVSYFIPPQQLYSDLWQAQLGGWALFWALFYSFATWGNAGFMREQVCKYMCPYARFQSVMFDQDTLLIGYDKNRGEPRKQARLNPDLQGDCINCTLCVQVCPTGIDIRDGLQYECIACAACIDACDDVMDKINKPKGLIRYSTAHHDAGGKIRILRTKSIAYGLVFAALIVAFGVALSLRSPIEIDITRDRSQLFVALDDGSVNNVYDLHLTSKQEQASRISIVVKPSEGFSVSPNKAYLPARGSHHQKLTINSKNASAIETIKLQLIDHQGQVLAEKTTRFIGVSP